VGVRAKVFWPMSSSHEYEDGYASCCRWYPLGSAIKGLRASPEDASANNVYGLMTTPLLVVMGL